MSGAPIAVAGAGGAAVAAAVDGTGALLPRRLPLDALETPGVRRGLVAPAVPAEWRLAAFAGRFAEISSGRAAAGLTLAFRLVHEAQQQEEPVAWVARETGTFYPPDAADAGIDLQALAVVRVPDMLSAARAADRLLRSGAFGLVALDLGRGAQLPLHAQTRLVGLAKKHGTALVCLTEKEERDPSLGSLVSLRAQAVRAERTGDRYRCDVRVVKDKRRGPGWAHREVCRGPDGLC